MNYKYNLDEIVYVKLAGSNAEVMQNLTKGDTNLYQVKILEGKYKEKLLWFAEHELNLD